MLALLRRDLDRWTDLPRRVAARRARTRVETILFRAGFHAAALHRVSHWLGARGWTWTAWLIARANLTLTGADIEFSAAIGPGLLILHPSGVVVGRGTRLGSDVTLFQGVTFGIRSWETADLDRYPTAGDRCVFYARCSVLGGVSLGDDVTVGAHALVLGDLPAGACATGAPARARVPACA